MRAILIYWRNKRHGRRRKKIPPQGHSILYNLPHDVVVVSLSRAFFSLKDEAFGRMTASWLVILRPRARSTLAPSASLFRLSAFSGVGTNRCFARGLFSKRSMPSEYSLISAIRGSALDRLEMVLSEGARDGVLLMVEKRLELRLELSCSGNQRVGVQKEKMEVINTSRKKFRVFQMGMTGSGENARTDGAMIGLSESNDGWRAMFFLYSAQNSKENSNEKVDERLKKRCVLVRSSYSADRKLGGLINVGGLAVQG